MPHELKSMENNMFVLTRYKIEINFITANFENIFKNYQKQPSISVTCGRVLSFFLFTLF